jgi:hypothetical protein
MSKCIGSFLGFDLFVSTDRDSLRFRAIREDGAALRVELPLRLRADAHLGVKVDPGEGDVLVTVGLGATLYVGVETRTTHRLARRLCPDHKARAVEAYITPADDTMHDWHAHWNVWTPIHEWSHTTPAWRNGGFFLPDVLFGAAKYTKREVDRVAVVIPMPEGVYPAEAVIEDATWTRPRWPFGPWHRARSITLDCPQGVPHPGKGENAWDCDDDATFAMSTRARTVGEAIGDFVGSVMERRAKYSGLDWRPSPRTEVAA